MYRLLLLLTLFVTVSATAQDFKILFLNTESIRIGSKSLKVGDCFSQSDRIHWSNDRQAMKVLSLSDKKMYILVSSEFKGKNTQSAKDFFVKTNRMSTRGAGSLSSVARNLGDTIYIIDNTLVSVDYIPDTSEYFFLKSCGNRYVLEYIDGALLFTTDILTGDGPVEADMFYHFADGEEECVTEGIRIVRIPERIKR